MIFKSNFKSYIRPFCLTVRWYNDLAKSNSRIKRGVSLTILGGIAFLSVLGVFQIVDPYSLENWTALKETLNGMGFSGILSYLCMVAILPLFSPLTLVIITGSAAFGPFKGFFFSYIGCLINANIVYLLVKSLSLENSWGKGRKSIQIKDAIQKHGYVIVMSLQLITIIPFTLINAVAAGAGISWKEFMKATSIGLCPCILLYSFMGSELTENMISPRIYFAGVFVMVILLIDRKSVV